MPSKTRSGLVLAVLGGLAACAPQAMIPQRSLEKGAQITVQALLAAHDGYRICTEHDPATDSCASIIDVASVNGDSLVSRETGALRSFAGGAPETITLVSRGMIDQGRNCVMASDVSIAKTSLDADTAAFVLDTTRDLIAQAGGVCASYFESGDGYVVSTRGRDGSIFPPGDTRLDFFTGSRSLRPQ